MVFERDPSRKGWSSLRAVRAATGTFAGHQQHAWPDLRHQAGSGNRTQSTIATELGISQMHVSRLLSRALALLREAMLSVSGRTTLLTPS